jgi:putative transposase
MSNLRRYFRQGDTSFITCVTYNRTPILTGNEHLLAEAIKRTNERIKFNIIAQIVMPDHFHLIVHNEKGNLSNIMQRIKMSFAALYRKETDIERGRVWQNRFWDHIIRNQDDLNRHTDYIHYNPVKHGFVRSPFDWQYSSIHEFAKAEVYQPEWGKIGSLRLEDYGE